MKDRGVFTAKKGPKTLKGMERKFWTGDGRKTAPGEKAMKEMKKQAEELLFGKRRNGKRRTNSGTKCLKVYVTLC